jgi:hypothetical protein
MRSPDTFRSVKRLRAGKSENEPGIRTRLLPGRSRLLHLLENLESAQALNVLILYRITVKTHGLSEKQKP